MAKGIRAILHGQEPALPKRPLAQDLGETIMNRGVDAAVAQYRGLKRTRLNDYDFNESVLNRLGYMLLEKNRNSDAIANFKLNVEEYPKSANVYDSLAEAYAKGNQKQLAIQNYRKSLELDPKNQNAAEKLKELEQKCTLFRYVSQGTMAMSKLQAAVRKPEPITFLLTVHPARTSRRQDTSRSKAIPEICRDGEALWPRPCHTRKVRAAAFGPHPDTPGNPSALSPTTAK